MAGHNGGRRNAVNVSQYIANLNKEPSAFEVATSEEQNYGVDDESLAQFTNTDFFDFDTADFLNESNGVVRGMGGFGDDGKAEKRPLEGEKTGNGLEFANAGFPLQAVNPYEVTTGLSQQTPQQQQQQQPSQPLFQNYPPLPSHPSTTTTTFPQFPTAPVHNASSPTDSTSDPSRALAEEDKRRRNTAASARFRVKKKQREQALEQKTMELEKAKQGLEQRVGQLETENEWLRGLVVEKNGSAGEMVGKNKRVPESETDSGKKGVGTDA